MDKRRVGLFTTMSLEGQHWYDAQANSCHTIVGKNGRERSTTIRDAKANGWLPSVSTVLSILSKPQLDNWKMRQVAMAAITKPRDPEQPLDDKYLDTIIADAFKQVGDAADLGTSIHKAIEQWGRGEAYAAELFGYVEGVKKLVEAQGIAFDAHELRLASVEHGFAGTTDAAYHIPGTPRRGILDFKSRKSDPKYPMTPWDGQPTQIAAYHMAHYGEIRDDDMGINVFISTTEPGRVEHAWYPAHQLREEWETFQHLLAVWRALKKYDPRKGAAA